MNKVSDTILKNLKSLHDEHGKYGLFHINEQYLSMSQLIKHLEDYDEIGQAFEDAVCQEIIKYFMGFARK